MILKCASLLIKYWTILSWAEQQPTQISKAQFWADFILQPPWQVFPSYLSWDPNISLTREKTRNFKPLSMTRRELPHMFSVARSRVTPSSRPQLSTQLSQVLRDHKVQVWYLPSRTLCTRCRAGYVEASIWMNKNVVPRKYLTNKSIKERSHSVNSLSLIQMNLILLITRIIQNWITSKTR